MTAAQTAFTDFINAVKASNSSDFSAGYNTAKNDLDYKGVFNNQSVPTDSGQIPMLANILDEYQDTNGTMFQFGIDVLTGKQNTNPGNVAWKNWNTITGKSLAWYVGYASTIGNFGQQVSDYLTQVKNEVQDPDNAKTLVQTPSFVISGLFGISSDYTGGYNPSDLNNNDDVFFQHWVVVFNN